MEMLFTKEKEWLEKWDKFVYSNKRGNHLIFSDWLRSYDSYGFDFEIGICVEDEKIVGGFGAIIAKLAFFKFYIVPHGPLTREGYEIDSNFLIQNLQKRAKIKKCCYAQYSIPYSDNNLIESYVFKLNLKNRRENKGKQGNLFKHVYSSYGLNWVDFNCANSEEFLKQLALQPRRNIKLAYKNNFEVKYAKNEQECREAYKLIEQNAKEANYSVRNFEDIKKTILNLIDKEKAFLMMISFNNNLKGAGLFVDTGNYLTYISGGVKREKPDLNIGYIIHWEAIKMSFDFHYKGYNISMGGSEGVQKFKAKFNAIEILFDHPHYHFILNPVIFKLYMFLNKYLKKNKERISLILKNIK